MFDYTDRIDSNTFKAHKFLLEYKSDAFSEITKQLLTKFPDCNYIFTKEHSLDNFTRVLVFLEFPNLRSLKLSELTLLIANNLLECNCRMVGDKELCLLYVLKSVTEPFLKTNIKTEIIKDHSFFFRNTHSVSNTSTEKKIMSDTQKDKLLNHLVAFEMEFNSESQDLSKLNKTLKNARNFFYNKKYVVDKTLIEKFNQCKKNLSNLKRDRKANKK